MSEIIKMWMFASSSSNSLHETLLKEDGTTSCRCNGWTRRCVNGLRTCRHTRAVDAGTADSESVSWVEYDTNGKVLATKTDGKVTQVKPKVTIKKALRAPTKTNEVFEQPKRRIQW